MTALSSHDISTKQNYLIDNSISPLNQQFNNVRTFNLLIYVYNQSTSDILVYPGVFFLQYLVVINFFHVLSTFTNNNKNEASFLLLFLNYF